uniref:Uncharacterized protein n=1 Tax=Anguilla anguilla TaxID=7936 RepID=A0A0E9QL33_ANGAN
MIQVVVYFFKNPRTFTLSRGRTSQSCYFHNYVWVTVAFPIFQK